MGHKGFAVVTIVFLVLAWNSWKDNKPISLAAATTTAVTYTNSNVNTTTVNTNQYTNIDQTLWVVAQKWKTTDVDGDGLHNCIDAAVLFYQYYPDKSKVAIIINKNSSTGMNHLFNAVLINGIWVAIEPQAYATNQRSYHMQDIWGSQYDSTFNRDETERWKIYAR